MKKVFINIIIILSMFMTCNSVKAETSLKLNLESNKYEIQKQDEVIITLKIEKSIDKFINAYKATIEYDKSIFEEITDNNFHCKNSWTNLKYNEDNQQFIVINQDNNVEIEEVLEIHLKVKDNIKVEKTSIKIKDITTSYGEYDMVIESQEKTLKVISDEKEENQKVTNKSEDANQISEEVKIRDENGNNDTKLSKEEDIKISKTEEAKQSIDVTQEGQALENDEFESNDQTESKTDIYQEKEIEAVDSKEMSSVEKNNFVIYVIFFAITIIFIIVFIKNKKSHIAIILVIVCISVMKMNVLADTTKIGDINNDRIINISDVELLEEGLIKIKNIENVDVADINRDNKITITDLSLLIKKINEKTTETNTKTAQEAVQEMKIGWNLGNTLDSCDYQKKHSVTYYETHWGNPVTTKSMIDEIKKAGFNSVRVPVTYYDHINDEGIIDEEWLDRVEEVVNYVLDNDMYCIIDIHHDTGLYEGGSWIKADADKYEENAQKLSNIWKQIALKFKDYGYKLVFEGFNEIVDTNKNYDWTTGYNSTITVNKLNQVFVDTVRQTGGKNTDRFLAVSTFGAITDEQKLSTFVMPNDIAENKIILALHDYSNTTSSIDKMLARIKKYCVDKNIPVILDEFGTTSSVAEEQRAEMANYYVSEAKKLGVTCFWWDNGGSYQLFNRRNMNWSYPKIKEALIKGVS